MSDFTPFISYAAAMSITPGPNNAMLATLGARHGWRGAAPAAFGVMTGMFLLLLVAGTGVGAAISAVPSLRSVLTVGGVLYMGYLAYVLWHAEGAAKERPPMGFWGAVAFQTVNPKALLMALTAAGGFSLPWGGPAGMAALFVLVGGPCIAVWALAGDRLRRWLDTPARARLFSRAMAVLVACTAIAMVIEG
ncbi:MAG: hypothetical protein JWM80_3642 [Cyanobacteria bacterium RYN_339]|nr:hypothetical protein [Cyanobacteria bacterium RYN_339]